MFSKITSFISASLQSLIPSRREPVDGGVPANRPSKRSRETRGGRPPSKTRRRQSHVSFGTAKRTRAIHYSPSPVPSEIPASPPLQHMSAEQQRAYKAGEVVVKEEPEDDVKISPLGSRRRSRRRSIPGRSSPHRTHVQALHPAQEGGHTRSGRRVQRPKFFSPDGEMVPSDTNKYVIVLSDSESD